MGRVIYGDSSKRAMPKGMNADALFLTKLDEDNNYVMQRLQNVWEDDSWQH